jgi:hypothetical protein
MDQSQNVVHMPDGSTQIFPGEATPEQMAEALKQAQASPLSVGIPTRGGVQSTPTSLDSVLSKAIDFVRPFAGMAGGMGGATLGAIGGPVGAFAGETQGYAGIDALLQQLKPGETPSVGESLKEGEKQALLNAVGGRITGALFRGAIAGGKAIVGAEQPEIYSLFPTTAQALEANGNHILATSAKYLEDIGAPWAKKASLERSGLQGSFQALGFAKLLNGSTYNINQDPVKLARKIYGDLGDALEPVEKPANFKSWPPEFKATQKDQYQLSQEAQGIAQGGSNPFQKLNNTIDNNAELEKMLVVGRGAGTNTRRDLQSYQFMRMYNDATTKTADGSVRIDPEKVARTWNDPEMQSSLQTLYGSKTNPNSTYQQVQQFMNKIATVQDKTTTAGRGITVMAGGMMLSGSIFSSLLDNANIHIPGGYSATVAGMYIPAALIGAALTQPQAARVLTAIAGGEPLSASMKLSSRLLFDAMQGSAAVVGADGKKTWGSFKKDANGSTQWVSNQ